MLCEPGALRGTMIVHCLCVCLCLCLCLCVYVCVCVCVCVYVHACIHAHGFDVAQAPTTKLGPRLGRGRGKTAT